MDPWGKLACLSARELRERQNKKLHAFINQYLYPFSPHYRQFFDQNKINPRHIRTIEDLKNIPFTSKTDFFDSQHNPEKFRNFILQPDKSKIKQYWPKTKLMEMAFRSLYKGERYAREKLEKEFRPLFLTFTTGTTNKPVPFIYSHYDLDNLYVSGARMLNVFGMSNSENAVNIFPYAPHLAFWQVVFGGFSSGLLILSTGGGKVMSSEGNVGALLKMKPAMILGVPSYVYHILRLAKEKNCDFSFVKKIVLGASRISQAFKIRLAELLWSMGAKDVAVLGTYGFTESRTAWGECPTTIDISSGHHLYPDKEVFEVIDPNTGEVKKEGQDGELVYTSLDSRGSVVLRYRTGDFVRGGIRYEPCPCCKRTVPRISSDITRIADVKDLKLSKVKGTLVNLNDFSNILTDMDMVSEWQIEIRKKDNDPFEVDELIIYVCPKDDANTGQLEDMIKNKISAATEVTPNAVKFVSLNELVKRLELETASKEKRIVDLRPK